MNDIDSIINNLVQELKRGTLVLSVLLNVHQPTYGYLLVQKLQEKGIDVDQNTLYPLLRRLEKQELLTSNWDTHGTRPRKYYAISDKGMIVLEKLIEHWESSYTTLNAMIKEASQ